MKIWNAFFIISFFTSAVLGAETIQLNIGVNDPLCAKTTCECVAENAKRSYEGFAVYIKEKTGIELVFHYYEESMELENEIKSGNLDGMICKCWSGLIMAREAGRSFKRLGDLTRPTGESGLRGIFITLKNSPLKTLADLKDRKIAFGDSSGYEKHYLAFKTLKRVGIEVLQKREEYFSCKEGALAVLEKRADAAVISDYAMEYDCIVVVGSPDDFRIIGETSESIPFITFLLDTATAPEIHAKLSKALFKITGENIPEGLFSKGWIMPMPWNPEELTQ